MIHITYRSDSKFLSLVTQMPLRAALGRIKVQDCCELEAYLNQQTNQPRQSNHSYCFKLAQLFLSVSYQADPITYSSVCGTKIKNKKIKTLPKYNCQSEQYLKKSLCFAVRVCYTSLSSTWSYNTYSCRKYQPKIICLVYWTFKYLYFYFPNLDFGQLEASAYF